MSTALVAILTVIAGFGPSIVNTAARNAPVTLLVASHGIFCLVWLLIFLTQALLIRTRQIAVHRRLGAMSAVVAVGIVATSCATIVEMARRGFDLSGDLGFKSHVLSLGPLSNLIAFAVLIAAGYLYRQRGDIHKRLMVLAIAGGLMPAPLAHIVGHSAALRQVGVIILIPIVMYLFASAVYDRYSLGHFHQVSLWGGIAVFIWDALAIAVGHSAMWHQFSKWVLR